MKRPFILRAALTAAISLLPLLAGCGKKSTNNPFGNAAPTVRLTNAPASNRQVDAYYYAVTLNWVGYDPDGRVAYYLYAVDPPATGDTTWVRTEKNEEIILFRSTRSNKDTGVADDPHVFALKAVDNLEAKSATVYRAFFSKTTAPTVQVTDPRASSQARKYVTPAIRISWEGEDVDGVFTKKPVKYKYKLLTEQSEVPLSTALADRDSVRRYYAPRNWAGWDSTSAETTQVSFTNLIPDQEYIFCVIAFDEAGAYSPVFSRDQNMLYFRVTFAGQNNPKITFFNEFFQYTYDSGSYEPNNRTRYVLLELPANEFITFNWFAVPIAGSEMRSYRWCVDNQDLSDQTPRQDENDITHWSTKSLNTTSATIGPYPGSVQPHRFYLEAEDINGLVSLGIIEFTSVQATFEKPLLVVKDTRYLADQRSVGEPCMDKPKGRWPTQAELDTFLFARGGFQWRCYPTGTLTSPGIFSAYSPDTIGTRTGREDQSVRLSVLGRYKNVVWIGDKNGAGNFQDGTGTNPKSALRYMCEPNRLNTLAAYLKQGGRVWMVGGGALTSTVVAYDKTNNNTVPPAPSQTFSFTNGELIPGRMAYDWAKWQVEFKDNSSTIQVRRDANALGRNQNNPFYLDPTLPSQMSARSAATDPFPPNRVVFNGDFYYSVFDIEYQSGINHYYEDLDPGLGENFVDGIDSLYRAQGASLPQTSGGYTANSCMTVYPARTLWGVGNFPNGPKVIATGFDIWSYQKTQCKGLVDWVLQKLLNVTPTPSSLRAERTEIAPAPGAPPRGAAPAARSAPGSITTTRSIRTAPTPGREPGR